MKTKRLLNVFLAVTMILTVTASPSAVRDLRETGNTDNKTVVQQNTIFERQNEEEQSYINETAEVESSVSLNMKTIEKYENPDDSFYKPSEESVTVLEDSSAYINDAVTVFFSDAAAEKDKQRIVDSLGGEILGRIDFMNEYEISISSSDFESITALCDKLMQDDSVEFASCSFATQYESNYVPDDPWSNYCNWDDNANSGTYSYYNWWITSTDIDKAWNYNDKFSKINIGIVDSGFNKNNEDLSGRISFPNAFFEKYNSPDGHGTHVAGIIGAIQDNGIGISGVVRDCNLICVDWIADKEDNQNWNSGARIMSGFINTVRSGAKVINFSLGNSSTIENGTTNRYQFVKDAEGKYFSFFMAKMLQKGYDFICCQSAGNGTKMKDGSSFAVDASNNGSFCTVTKENAVKFVNGVTAQDILDRIIIVAAAKFKGNDTYEQASFSNGGSQVSVCAPGVDILSTYYSRDESDLNYALLNGTSMATPIVTGIASMVWSINQNFTGAQVKHFVCDKENTRIDVADNADLTHLPTGSIPMVNALLAVEAAIKATENDGAVSGKISMMNVSSDKRIRFSVKNNDTDELFRLITGENGEFTAELPAGEYTLSFNTGGKAVSESFNISKGETTELEEIVISGVTIDYDSYIQTVIDNLQEMWAFIRVY